ncbi:hypothetical protein LXL04_014967 [Taraxacum kok-saghyz]
MPLGKYHCDYCDKQFQDTPFHRKRHIQGLQHQKAKALWYASIPRDPNQVSLQSSTVGLCNRFIRTGSCPYGDSCKYVHPNQNFPNMNMQGFPGAYIFFYLISFKYLLPVIYCSSQLQIAWKLNCQVSQGVSPLKDPHYQARGMVVDRMGVMLGNVPPSLRPPPEGGYPPIPFVDWG